MLTLETLNASDEAGFTAYPALGLGHTIKAGVTDLQLVRFVKEKELEADPAALVSTKPQGTWHLKNTPRPQQAVRPALPAVTVEGLTVSNVHVSEDPYVLGVD